MTGIVCGFFERGAEVGNGSGGWRIQRRNQKEKKKSEGERITLKVVVDASGLERAAGKNSSLWWW